MINTSWRDRVGRLLLVLGLVAGPWPAAMASTAPMDAHQTATMQQMDDEAPCPMDEHAAAPPCHCCDDGAPCSGAQCVLSTAAPGLPVVVTSLALIPDGVRHDADLIPRPPEPRTGERLRPPIA